MCVERGFAPWLEKCRLKGLTWVLCEAREALTLPQGPPESWGDHPSGLVCLCKPKCKHTTWGEAGGHLSDAIGMPPPLGPLPVVSKLLLHAGGVPVWL